MRVCHSGKWGIKDIGRVAWRRAGGGRIGRRPARTILKKCVSSRTGKWGSGTARGALQTEPSA